MTKTAAETADPKLRRQPHGGALLDKGVPGNRGGSGRPPSAIRQRCLTAFDARISVAESIADDHKAAPRDRLAALDLLARLGGLEWRSYDPRADAQAERFNLADHERRFTL